MDPSKRNGLKNFLGNVNGVCSEALEETWKTLGLWGRLLPTVLGSREAAAELEIPRWVACCLQRNLLVLNSARLKRLVMGFMNKCKTSYHLLSMELGITRNFHFCRGLDWLMNFSKFTKFVHCRVWECEWLQIRHGCLYWKQGYVFYIFFLLHHTVHCPRYVESWIIRVRSTFKCPLA